MTKSSTGQLARIHGVTTQTIRRWIRKGVIEGVEQTVGGHFRIQRESSVIIGYARVSSAKQKPSIASQSRAIKRKYKGIRVVSDIGSGFNFKRRNFVKILERAMRGDAITVVVANNDRLTRGGFGLVKCLVEFGGGEIVSLDPGEEEPEQFDLTTLVGFITSFCNSYYGKRSKHNA